MLGIGVASGGTHTTYMLDWGDGPVAPDANETGDSISSARDNQSNRAAVAWIVRAIENQQDDDICVWIGAAGFSAPLSDYVSRRFGPEFNELRQSKKRLEVFIANDAVS